MLLLCRSTTRRVVARCLRLSAGAGTVTHFIEGAWFANLENKAQVRTFRLEENRLILEAATPWGVIRNT